MRRSSKYYPLSWLVECKSSYHFFETIAAFNHDGVAVAYAKDCKKVNQLGFEYHVLYLSGNNKLTQIWPVKP